MMQAIVGIEISIGRIESKLKASQDEDLQDRHGTVKGLRMAADDQSRTMAELILNAVTREATQS